MIKIRIDISISSFLCLEHSNFFVKFVSLAPMSFFSALKLIFSKKEKTSASLKNADSSKRLNNKENSKSMSSSEKTSSITNSKMDSISGDSKQLSSSGKNYKYRDGRRYHGNEEVAYLLPNDDDGKAFNHWPYDQTTKCILLTEADRVHQQHWILRYALQW